MRNESHADTTIDRTEPEQESRFRKYAPAAFMTAVVMMPVVNLVTVYFGYKTSKNQLELEKMKDMAERIAEQLEDLK